MRFVVATLVELMALWLSACSQGAEGLFLKFREMSLANPLWSAPRVHGELLKLGIEVAQSTVAKYMSKSGQGRSQTWKRLLHNHAAGIAAMDFLVVPTIGCKLLFIGRDCQQPRYREPMAQRYACQT
jgi:hypothetical protein